MRHWELLKVNLRLFDGEGGGAGGASAGVAAPQGALAPSAGEQPAQQPAQKPEEKPADARERRKAYRALINGEYKDLYTEDTQRMLDRRYGEVKTLQERLDRNQPVLDLLAQRYGVTDGDPAKLARAIESDHAYWSEAAAEAGMSVEQFRQMKKLERENAALKQAQRVQEGRNAMEQQLKGWMQEGEALKAKYPGFDFRAETQNPQFLSLLHAGVPLEHAWRVLHMDEIVSSSIQTAAAEAEKRVTENIRARGDRPAEAGGAQAGTVSGKIDVSKLTKKDMAELRRRALNGERITFT